MRRCSNCRLPIETDASTDRDDTETLCQPCATLTEETISISVSPLEQSDLELVLAWRSNPEIYRHFRNQDGPLNWEEHVTWFESCSPDRYDFIIHYDGRRVGVVNLGTDNEVGIYLGDFSAHGQGIATKALNWICQRFADRQPLKAEVHKRNERSHQLFRRCGFTRVKKDGDWVTYSYNP